MQVKACILRCTVETSRLPWEVQRFDDNTGRKLGRMRDTLLKLLARDALQRPYMLEFAADCARVWRRDTTDSSRPSTQDADAHLLPHDFDAQPANCEYLPGPDHAPEVRLDTSVPHHTPSTSAFVSLRPRTCACNMSKPAHTCAPLRCIVQAAHA
jgi:hypothetical protein